MVSEPAVGVVPSSPKDHSGHDHSGHSHEPLEVSQNDQILAVTLTVLKDPMSGWNAKGVVEHFRFAPENASQDHVAGEGHEHLYVDGVKTTGFMVTGTTGKSLPLEALSSWSLSAETIIVI